MEEGATKAESDSLNTKYWFRHTTCEWEKGTFVSRENICRYESSAWMTSCFYPNSLRKQTCSHRKEAWHLGNLQTCIFLLFLVKPCTMFPTWWCMFPRQKRQCYTPSAVEDKQMNTRQKECVCVKACRATSLGMNLFQSLSVFPNQLSHGCHMHSLLYLPNASLSASLSCSCSVSHTQNTLCQIPYACSGNDKSLQRPALLCQKGCWAGLECPSFAWLAMW